MLAENPLALAYLLPADVYLLAKEKHVLGKAAATADYQEQLSEAQPLVSEPPPGPEPITAQVPQAEITLATEIPVIQTPVLAFNYVGGNAQRFLILVHYPDHDLMEPSHLSALESTIKRKELAINDVAILNLAKHPGTELKAFGAFFKPRKMLLLGADTFPVGLTPPVLNELTMLGKCHMLYSFSFDEMMGNKDNTKAFWEQMKAL